MPLRDACEVSKLPLHKPASQSILKSFSVVKTCITIALAVCKGSCGNFSPAINGKQNFGHR